MIENFQLSDKKTLFNMVSCRLINTIDFQTEKMTITINVRLILKVREIIVFLRDKFQIMHFRGIF